MTTWSSRKGNYKNVSYLYKTPVIFNVVLQTFVGTALALSCILRGRGAICTAEPLLLGYIFLLEIISAPLAFQAYTVRWQVIRRQIVALLISTTILAVIMDIIPLLLIHNPAPLRPQNMGKTVTLLGCIIVILFTPRTVIINSKTEDVSSLIGRRHIESASLPEAAPEEYCSPFSYCISYGWITSLILRGCRQKLTMDDLPILPHYDEPHIWLKNVLDARRRGVTTLKTVAILMHRELATQALFAATTALIEFVAPFAMYNLLSFLQNSNEAVLHPALWVALLFLGPVARSVSYQQYIFTSTRFIVRLKISFIQEIYHKALGSIIFESLPKELDHTTKEGELRNADGDGPMEDDSRAAEGGILERGLKSHDEGESGVGHIMNLMSFDTDAIESARDIVLICIAVPIEMAVATTFLYKLLGWSALAGLAVMILSISLPTLFSHKMIQIQQRVMERSDKRISLITEYLHSIRIIKYFGWERAMADKVKEARRLEQAQIWKRNLFAIAVVWSGDFIPLFALLVMFTTYTIIQGQPLHAATAFTCLSITETLRQQFVWVSNVSGFVSQAVVSIRRIDNFFSTAVPKTEVAISDPSFKHATILRSPNGPFRLYDLNIEFLPGCLNVITGPTGSGKTSLLLSLLGETILESGEVTCPHNVAYVSQAAWLWSGTVRENILFHSEFDEQRYNATVKACGLVQDFDELPNRDSTEVGEQGATLSGGQKQRVSLARAVYSTASTLLLDDVFSALDVTTTNFIFNEFFRKGFLGERTILLVSHLPSVINAANLVVNLDNGRAVSVKTQIPVLEMPRTLEKVSNIDLLTSSMNGDQSGAGPSRNKGLEKSADGRIPRSLFFKYMLQFGGYPYAMLALCTAFCTQIVFFSMTLWLSVWTGAYTKEGAVDIGFYLGTYACILLGFNVMVPLNNTVFQYGAWKAARKLHTRLTDAILNVPVKWFDVNAIGTVLNRFSSDMDSLDSIIVNWLRMTLDNQIRLCLRIGAIASILPIFALPAAILCSIGFAVGEMYTRAQISIKRLTSATQSPIFAHFSETLIGLPTIRAQNGMTDVFGLVLSKHLYSYARAFEALFNSNRWVSVRADMVAASVAAAAGTIAVVKSQSISAGLVGFSLTNAIGLSQTILSMVRNMNELEVELNSFQRVIEYSNLKSEEDEIEDAALDNSAGHTVAHTPASWPTSGTVTFDNFAAGYSRDGPEVIKNISFQTRPGERIGIVGRTGSGKSSLGLSLLRFTNKTSGSILIDGIDTSSIDLARLRRAVTIIPQEPTLFAGDVRSNIDPFNELDETELNNVLRVCGFLDATPSSSVSSLTQAKEHVAVMVTDLNSTSSSSRAKSPLELGLTTPVTANGANFSRGQRQILCMARAICRRSKIVLLDEATSSVDDKTDLRIQEVLRTEFPGSTIFTVAHRLKTIMDYDRILVLSAGEIVELDTPRNLVLRKGTFWKMVMETGEVDELLRTMQ